MESHVIKIKCNCGYEMTVDLDEYELSWEIIETGERNMGNETTHEAELSIDCEKCGEVVTITLRVWEYPDGVFNTQEINIEGGQLVGRECDLRDFVL